MDDKELHARISHLVEEERQLRAHPAAGHGLDDSQRARMHQLEEQLDQLWDLLRRREAREEFGQNPNQEHLQPVKVVENYKQ
jgi:hypothetical protein